LKLSNGLIAGRNQLQWVVLLLAAAVALPTVSLLWFMSRVVANERLAIREKLAALYQDKLADAAAKTEALCAAKLNALDKIKPAANPYSLFTKLVLENNLQGVIVLGSSGTVAYPVSADITGEDVSTNSPLAEAWQLEFIGRKYAEAAKLYDQFSSNDNLHVALAAIMGKSRCLSRQGLLDEATAECQKAAFFSLPEYTDPALQFAVENARLLLLSLIKQSSQPQLHSEVTRRTVSALLADLYNHSSERALLPANQNLFIAKKVLEVFQNGGLIEDAKTKERLEKLIAAEEYSISVAENLSLVRTIAVRPADTFFRVGDDYGFCHRTESATLLVFVSRQEMASVWDAYDTILTGAGAKYRIVDESGVYAAGETKPEGSPFVAAGLPACLSGWKAELYFGGTDVFEKAAKRQIAVYIWTGVLVILFIFAAGGFALKAVSRQIRLNKMKNDFIATVSHELKTPLASMRVLVDTLLEGNIKDEAQAEEYLRLTSKENERLSRMIDNFLTFSRMERNKKVFTIVDTKPAAIVDDAVEAVRTKFAAHNCRLTVDIADNPPDIQADHDAIVTVLVNLLDNACKYTGDNKQIALKVFADDGNVCFAVSDNGIGLGKRQIRRIFDSFYQVDNSLARKAEGCGLGLSIVKFIVDAHKGTISVESKPGKGSTFTVKIPLSVKVS
jgi:signal transduction histidine kinase